MKLKIIQATVIIFIFNVAYADNNREYNEIIENLRCLVCQNQSLAESDSNLAKDLRSKVKSMLESGKSQDNIYNLGAKVMRALGLEKGGKR